MRFKRLYYNPAIHGGSVGVHDLMQGHAIPDLVFGAPGQFRVLATLAGVMPGDSFDIGTVDQPDVIYANWPPEYDVVDACGQISGGSALITIDSSWAIRVNVGTFTAGLYEFLIPLWVS